jgi:hypothetical protein
MSGSVERITAPENRVECREALMIFLLHSRTATIGKTRMEGLYTETFKWFGIASACVLPAIIAAAFGRGFFMIAATAFSLLAFLKVTPYGRSYFAWFAPPGTSFWYSLAIPVGIAVACACIAIIQQRRKT